MKFVYLQGEFDLIARRLKERKSHFFKAALLRSQFDSLEIPKDALVVDIARNLRRSSGRSSRQSTEDRTETLMIRFFAKATPSPAFRL